MTSPELHIRWPIVVTIICGFIFATFCGALIGQSSFVLLILGAVFAGVLCYVVFLKEYTWHFALLICFVGLVFRPVGFDFGPMEISCGLGFLLLLSTGWIKGGRGASSLENQPGFSLVRGVLLWWLVYLVLHMLYNIRAPYRPADFALKNALKSYFAALAPAILLWYFSARPKVLQVGNSVLRVIAGLLLSGLIFNLGVAIYSLIMHHNPVDPDVSDQMPAFYIPILNTRENPFALRYLGPSAVLLSVVVLALGRRRLHIGRSVNFALFFLGIAGSFLSGGRATVVTAGLLALTVLLVTRRIRAIFIAAVFAILVVVALNVAGPAINRSAPLAVVRPLQWMLISKNNEAQSSIDSSSRWREELFHLAIDEWHSSARIFWFGRATYGFGVTDFVNAEITGAYRAAMEASLRRGATHNLITDLLVAYGLVGCLLYYALQIAVVRLLWLTYRGAAKDLAFRAFTLFCLITYASYLAVASVGGGFVLPEMIWLFIVWIAVLQNKRGEKEAQHEAELPPVSTMPGKMIIQGRHHTFGYSNS